MKTFLTPILALIFVLPPNGVSATTCATFRAPIAAGQLSNASFAGVSGMAASRDNPGAWWIHNDAGSGTAEAGKFYAVTSSGKLLGTWTLAGVAKLEGQGKGVVDIEDVAVGPGPEDGNYLYLADIGGNRYGSSGRSSIRIFRHGEPSVNMTANSPSTTVLTDYATITLTYPQNERYDAETLMVDANGDILVVTKNGDQGVSHVFAAAGLSPGQTTATLTRVATLRFGSGYLAGGGLAATAGDISRRGNEAVIRTYNRIFIWPRRVGASWAETFAQARPCMLPAASPQQYEAVAFDAKGISVYETHESENGNATINVYNRSKTTLAMIRR